MPYYIKKPKKKKELPLFEKTGIKVQKKADLKTKLDKVFSLYIRLRDSREFGFKYFRCISCGEIKPFDKADCGHYHSRRHTSTRWDEKNCFGECSYCNRFKADHLIGFKENLLRKIGKREMNILAWKASQTVKYMDAELRELIKYYQNLIKEIKDG